MPHHMSHHKFPSTRHHDGQAHGHGSAPHEPHGKGPHHKDGHYLNIPSSSEHGQVFRPDYHDEAAIVKK